MNKLITQAGLTLLMCILGFGISSAQTTIKGTVTDRKGEPLPGVKVAVKKGTNTTITDLDGTFTLKTYKTSKSGKNLVFSYGGYNRAQLKIRGNDTWIENADVKMRRTNAWNRMPGRKGNWLLGVESVMASPSSLPSLGLMVGWCKRVGVYAKCGFPLQSIDERYGDYGYGDHGYDSYYDPDYWWATDKSYASGHFLTIGCMFRLGCALHLYTGFGASEDNEIYTIAGGKKVAIVDDDRVTFELGLMTKFRNFYIHGGTMLNDFHRPTINIGAGVCF
ncbi:MAG: hypothetical protein E7117_00965 [Bacteroidales bacterium]|nr:hypothetical protein [Bacteroidales bacterium]